MADETPNTKEVRKVALTLLARTLFELIKNTDVKHWDKIIPGENGNPDVFTMQLMDGVRLVSVINSDTGTGMTTFHTQLPRPKPQSDTNDKPAAKPDQNGGCSPDSIVPAG